MAVSAAAICESASGALRIAVTLGAVRDAAYSGDLGVRDAGFYACEMAHSIRIERVLREFADAVDPQESVVEVLRLAAETLVRAVPADYWCGVLLDPATLLDTGGLYTSSFPDSVMPRLFGIEHVEQVGADNLRALARRRATVSLLSGSTGGDLAGDVYYRDILGPLGMADEMRVLLRQGAHVWGLLVWCRGSTFTADEVGIASALCDPAASALRAALLLSGTDDGDVVSVQDDQSGPRPPSSGWRSCRRTIAPTPVCRTPCARWPRRRPECGRTFPPAHRP